MVFSPRLADDVGNHRVTACTHRVTTAPRGRRQRARQAAAGNMSRSREWIDEHRAANARLRELDKVRVVVVS